MDFKQAYNQPNYLNFLSEKFNFSKTLTPITINNTEVKTFKSLGYITTADDKQLPVFEIHIKPNTKLSRNRAGLRNLVAKQIPPEDGALAVYVDGENKQWRFSFIAIEYKFTEDGLEKQQTASKRFTYLLGENAQIRTAKQRFETLNKTSTLADLKAAFAVEQLNKDFYKQLYDWYNHAKEKVIFPNDENAKSHIEDSLIRFLTRILFVWFLKEKHLINKDLFDLTKLKNLIKYEEDSSFYKAILQNLFFATLNRQIKDRSFRRTTNGKPNNTNYLAANIYRYQNYFQNNDEQEIMDLFKQTPFLNGGLFECLDREATDEEKSAYDQDKTVRKIGSAIRIDGLSDRKNNALDFDNALFFNTNETGLCDLFKQYQFTVEDALTDAGLQASHAEVTMEPATRVELNLVNAEKFMKLIERLEDLDDTQEVYHNADISDEVMAQL